MSLSEKSTLVYLIGILFLATSCQTLKSNNALKEHQPTAIGFTGSTATKPVFYGSLARDDKLELRLLSFYLDADDNITPEEFLEDGPYFHRTPTPIEEYTDELIARMMRGLVSEYPSLASIPIPNAMLLGAHTYNAFVMPHSACLPFPLILQGVETTNAPVAAIFPTEDGGRVKVGESCFTAIDRIDLDMTRAIQDVLNFFRVETPDCDLSWDNNTETFILTPGDDCQVPSNFTGAEQLAILRTTNSIYLHAGMLNRNTTFHDFAAILAHELVHFIRGHAHATFTHDFSDIIYAFENRTYPEIPAHRSDVDPRDYYALAGLATNAYDLTEAEFHGRLLKLFKLQTFQRPPSSICAGTSDTDACEGEYRALAGDFLRFLRKITYPAGPFLSLEQERKYLTFEQRLVALMAEVPFQNWFGGGILPEYLRDGSIYPDAMNDADLINFDPQQSTLSYLQIVTQKLRAKDIPAFDERQRLAELNYAKYTSEVEADEGMVELLAINGLPTNASNSAFLVMQAHVEHAADDLSIYNYSAIDCEAMRRSDWQRVPIWGSFKAKHPNPCWRTYNLDQLKKAVQFTPSAPISASQLAELEDQFITHRNTLVDLLENGQF